MHEGAVYVVAGHAGGDRLALIDLHPVMYTAEAISGSVVLQFNGSSVTGVNIRETGVVSDTFTVVKATQTCGVDGDCDDANACTDDTCSADPAYTRRIPRAAPTPTSATASKFATAPAPASFRHRRRAARTGTPARWTRAIRPPAAPIRHCRKPRVARPQRRTS